VITEHEDVITFVYAHCYCSHETSLYY